MIPQDLEDLLKVKTYWFKDSVEIQDAVNLIAGSLAEEDGTVVITRIFANNTIRIGKTVKVPGDPRKNEKTKEITIEHRGKMSVYQLLVEYFLPTEVDNF